MGSDIFLFFYNLQIKFSEIHLYKLHPSFDMPLIPLRSTRNFKSNNELFFKIVISGLIALLKE